MSYVRTNWVNDVTPLSAANMNNIEEGVVEAKTEAEEAKAIAISSASGAAVGSKFVGMRLSILGDSISTFGTSNGSPNQNNADGTWTYPGNRCRYPQADLLTNLDEMYWKILMDKTGMVFGINEAWAGSRVSNTQASDSGDQGPNRHIASKTRIGHLGENGTPDVIVVYGGTNDLGASVSVGAFDPASPCKFATLSATVTNPAKLTTAQMDDLKVDTFANAYTALLIRLQYMYPNAIIVCMLPNYCTAYYGANYNLMKQYCDVIKEICDYFGVLVMDTRKAGIGLMDMASGLSGSVLPDGIHPSAAGQALISEMLFNTLNSNYKYPVLDTTGGGTGGGTGGEDGGGGTGGEDEPNDPVVPTETTWYSEEVTAANASKASMSVNVAGYGWANAESRQAKLRDKPINCVRFVSAGTGGDVMVGKVASHGASTGELLVTKAWTSEDKDSNNIVTVVFDETISITGTEMLVWQYGNPSSSFRYGGTGIVDDLGFYSRVPVVGLNGGGSGSAWQEGFIYTLFVDYGYTP